MEQNGIQQLLRAEDEAAAIVQKAREKRVQRLRQAQEEAEKTIAALRAQHKAAFQAELAQKDQGDAGFATELKNKIENEKKSIEQGYEAHKGEVMDLLLRHVTTVQLEVGEALRQSLITKHETGTH